MEPCHAVDDSCCILPCLHSFHSVCIHPWLLENATCPICREAASTCNRGAIDDHSHSVILVMLHTVRSGNTELKNDLQEANDHILSLEMFLSETRQIQVFF
jgi:hypothetical protein